MGSPNQLLAKYNTAQTWLEQAFNQLVVASIRLG